MSDWVEDYDTISDTPSKPETDSNNNQTYVPLEKVKLSTTTGMKCIVITDMMMIIFSRFIIYVNNL